MASQADRSSRRLSALLTLNGSQTDAPSPHSDGSQSSSDRWPPVTIDRDLRGRLRKPFHNGRTPSGSIFSPPLSVAQHALGSDVSLNSASDLPLPPAVANTLGSRSSSPNFSRPSSRAPSRQSSRPATPSLTIPSDATVASTPGNKKKKRRSWLPGFSRKNSEEDQTSSPFAWVWDAGHNVKIAYNVSPLLNGARVPELWNESGDTYIYLFPRTSEKGPSFKVDSSIFAASGRLIQLAHGDRYPRQGFHAAGNGHGLESTIQGLSLRGHASPLIISKTGTTETENTSSLRLSQTINNIDEATTERNLYLPIALSTDGLVAQSGTTETKLSSEDVDTLVAVRNLFACLIGQSLIATERRPTIFGIFLKVSDLLASYEFSNFDGSTFGEAAATSFDAYVEELRLADVRQSREKTIEAIVLAERMRSVLLYNEAFVHGVGKYEDIIQLNSPRYQMISAITRNRMERANMDLYARMKSVCTRLDNFDFPSIFAGIMDSKTATEGKQVRFGEWKTSFLATRRYVMSFYRHKYGSWPPKASSRKNDLETSGLNRLVSRNIYHDFSNLYDLLVDRTSLTTRSTDMQSVAESDADGQDEPTHRALRRVLAEYDRSSPPVQPPVPFDTPLLPTLRSTRKDYGAGDARKDTKARGKKLKDDEIQHLLKGSYNHDSDISTPFLDAFKDLERRQAHNCTIDELCDLRVGQWLFLYCVLQALPMLVVDAPGVKWTHGVEYFLCEPPRGGVPWAREDVAGMKKSWYGIAGSTGMVSLPSDLVEHGVEGVYRRSHCWIMAEKWTTGIIGQELGEWEAEASDGLMSEYADTRAASQLSLPLPPTMEALGVEGALGSPSGRESAPSSRPGSRTSSPTRSRNRDSVMMLGLQQLPLPAGVAPAQAMPSPPASRNVSGGTMTFDDILGTVNGQQGAKKGKTKK